MEYLRLKKGNDWGNEYLAIEPKDEWGMAKAERGIKFRDGESVRVRWPDGHEEAVNVRLHWETVTVGDHGHDYQVTYSYPVVQAWLHGREVFVPLADLEVEAEWARARCPK